MNKKTFIELVTSHGSLILGAIFILFILLDNVNPAMNFISSSQGKFLLFVFCLLSMSSAARVAIRIHMWRVKRWKEERKKERDRFHY